MLKSSFPFQKSFFFYIKNALFVEQPSYTLVFYILLFQDLQVVCGDGVQVRTSTLLVAAISPWLRWLMEEAGEEFCLCLPSVTGRQLEDFLNTCLAEKPGEEIWDIHKLIYPKDWKKSEKFTNGQPSGLSLKTPFVKLGSIQKALEDEYYSKLEKLEPEDEIEDEELDNNHIDNDFRLEGVDHYENLEGDDENDDWKVSSDEGSDWDDDNRLNPMKMMKKKGPRKKKKMGRPLKSLTTILPKACLDCGETFSGFNEFVAKNKMIDHMENHKVENFLCDCPEAPKLILNTFEIHQHTKNNKYVNFNEVRQHMLVTHGSYYGCGKCVKCFESKDQLEVHVEEIHNQSHICDICGFEGSRLQGLISHKNMKHGGGFKTKKPENVNKQIRKKRKTVEKKTVLCADCGQSWTRDKSTYNEIRKHKMEHKVVNFTCDCPDQPKVFKVPETLGFTYQDISFTKKEYHMKVVHMGWHACTEEGCMKSFETKFKHAAHVKTHSMVCDICGWKGKHKASLSGHHARVHDHVEVQCQECGEVQKNKHALAKHKERDHTKVVCTVCAATVKNIRVHMTNQHMDATDMRYQCEHCNKGFMDKIKMDTHIMNVHIKTQPHQCRYGCENRYNDVSNRNAHERRRHGEVYKSPLKNKFC